MISAFGVEHSISKAYEEPKKHYGLRARFKAAKTLHQNKNNPQFRQALEHQMAVNQVKRQLQKNPSLTQTGPRSFESKNKVAKGLKAAHMETLKRVKANPSLTPSGSKRAASYAHDKSRLRALKDSSPLVGERPFMAGYHKKFMAKGVRVSRKTRDQNRSQIFGERVIP